MDITVETFIKVKIEQDGKQKEKQLINVERIFDN